MGTDCALLNADLFILVLREALCCSINNQADFIKAFNCSSVSR